MRLPIAYYGEPILRERAKEVEKIDDEILSFIKDMVDTINALPSTAGLAAPQVFRQLRIFLLTVVEKADDGSYVYNEEAPPEIYINPKLSNPSEEVEAYPQGCFSIPHVYAPVIRPFSIDVEFLNEKGETIKKRADGPLAQAVMHENDHLNGVLFIDRLTPKERKRIDSMLQKVKKEYYLKKKK
jgi:peptide deformylase